MSRVGFWKILTAHGRAAGLRGRRVLVVEDNDVARFVLRTTLSKLGMEVSEVGSGMLGVDAAREALARGGVALVVVQGRHWGWTSAPLLVVAVLALAAGVVFVRRSLHHPEPLLDLGLLRVRSFRVATLAAAFVATATASTRFAGASRSGRPRNPRQASCESAIENVCG